MKGRESPGRNYFWDTPGPDRKEGKALAGTTFGIHLDRIGLRIEEFKETAYPVPYPGPCHPGRLNEPDLPPCFSTSRTEAISMVRSTALHMS